MSMPDWYRQVWGDQAVDNVEQRIRDQPHTSPYTLMPHGGGVLATTGRWMSHDHRLFAPASCGGLGLRPIHDTRSSAFFAGWSAAFVANKERFPELVADYDEDGPEGRAFRAIYQGLPDDVRRRPQQAGHYHKLQHYLSACWWIDRTLAYVDNLRKMACFDWEPLDRLAANDRTEPFSLRLWKDLAHFGALRASGANAWMSACPSDRHLTLANEPFQSLFALRLGLPTHREEAAHVQVGRPHGRPPIFLDPEGRSILSLARGSKGHESQRLLTQLEALAKKARCAVGREPLDHVIRDARGVDRRPDLAVTLDGQVTLVDAVVVDPATRTSDWLRRETRTREGLPPYTAYLPTPSLHVLRMSGPLQAAIRRKNLLWRDLAQRRHYGFVGG